MSPDSNPWSVTFLLPWNELCETTRRAWAVFASVTMPLSDLQQLVEEGVTREIAITVWSLELRHAELTQGVRRRRLLNVLQGMRGAEGRSGLVALDPAFLPDPDEGRHGRVVLKREAGRFRLRYPVVHRVASGRSRSTRQLADAALYVVGLGRVAPDGVATLFRSFARRCPRQALRRLEAGVPIPAPRTALRPLLPFVGADDLVPLLRAGDPTLRKRALELLPRVGR